MTDAAALDLDALAADYVDDGYLVVPGLVGSEVVDAIRAELLAFADGTHAVANPPELPADASDEERLAAMLAVHFPHWVSPVIRDAVHHPGITSVLGRIVGAHLAHWDGGVKCMQSMLFAKPPGLPGQAWHQDERFIPTRDRSLIGVWIALDDADTENGCLWVLPGSHRRGYLWPTRPHGRPDDFDTSDESYGFDDGDAVPVPVRAGDVVMFNGYLLHRSFRNASADRSRRALVNHYMSSASLLPWMMNQGVDVAMTDYRTVEVVVGDDPYAWKGIDPPPHPVFLRPTGGAVNADELATDLRAADVADD